jgi:hypothetical protein
MSVLIIKDSSLPNSRLVITLSLRSRSLSIIIATLLSGMDLKIERDRAVAKGIKRYR